MPTTSVILSDEMDRYVSESIEKAFNHKFGAKKRVQIAALKLYADGLNGKNIQDEFNKSLEEINQWLEQANQKKAIESAKEILLEQTKEIINPQEKETLTHQIYGEPYPAKIVEEPLGTIPRSSEQEVKEVSFVSGEEEQVIPQKTTEIPKAEPVQVSPKTYQEYDKLSFAELIEAKTKFSEFKTQDDSDRYQYIIKRMMAVKPNA